MSWAVRATAAVAIVIAAAFSVSCLLYNAPKSPATVRLRTITHRALNPYFWQDWQLFGPNPGHNNGLIYLETRLKRDGRTVQTRPVEVEAAIDRTPRSFRLNPTKLPGIMLAFNEAMQSYTNSVAKIKKLPSRSRPAVKKRLDRLYQRKFAEMQRFFSARAHGLYPHATIIAVRAVFKVRPIVPFSDRYERPAPAEKARKTVATSWLSYVSGVAD